MKLNADDGEKIIILVLMEEEVLIYLDWNVVTSFKRLATHTDRKLANDLTQILNFIKNCREFFLFPYSNAHLRDLLPKKASNGNYIKEDLELLKAISKNVCVTQYWDEETPKLHIRQVEDHFREMELDKDLEIKSFEEYFDSASPSLGNLLKLYKNIPVPFEPTNDTSPTIVACFQNLIKEQTMYGLMKDIFELNKTIFSDYTIYKEIRNEFYKHFPIEGGRKDLGNILSILDANFKRPELSEVKKLSDKTYSKNANYDKFIIDYINIATYTPLKEKLPKGKGLRQIFNDAMHCFYGMYCDVFISNDKQALEKAEVLYTKYEVNTKLFTPSTFCYYLNQFKVNVSS